MDKNIGLFILVEYLRTYKAKIKGEPKEIGYLTKELRLPEE